MDIFDDPPRPTADGKTLQRKLDSLSIDALHDYIGELEEEIVRVRTEIDKKCGLQAAADQVFKT